MYTPHYWGPRWLWCLAILWFCALPSHSQTVSEDSWKSQKLSIEANLTSIIQTCNALNSLLKKQGDLLALSSIRLKDLEAQLQDSERRIASLEQDLKTSGDTTESLRQEIVRLQNLLARSQDSLKALSTAFDEYRAEAAKVVTQRNILLATSGILLILSIVLALT